MIKNPDCPENPHIRPNRTFICSVVFIDLAEYSKKPFVEQVRVKERFNKHLAETIKDISLSSRIVLDTGDGAAIGFIGDPEDALLVAMTLRDALRDDKSEVAQDLKVRMGINLGPVKILKDINNHMNMIGDGINTAERIMRFSEPGQLLVSRSYYDIISCLSQEYAQLFHYQGSRADKHVREHDIYSIEQARRKPDASHCEPEGRQGYAHTEDAAEIELIDPKTVQEPYRITRSKGQQPESLGRLKKATFIGGISVAVLAGLVFLSLGGNTPPEHAKGPANTVTVTAAGTSPPVTATVTPEQQLPESNPTAVLPKDHSIREKASNAITEPFRKAPRYASSRADDILFTVIGLKSLGNETTLSVRTYNNSAEDKQVALFDEAYWWSKSQITDETGEKHDVNRVVFLQGTEKIAMSLTGTQGIPIAPRQSVIANLVFKKAFNRAKSIDLHPFICHEGNCTEHNLVMPLRK